MPDSPEPGRRPVWVGDVRRYSWLATLGLTPLGGPVLLAGGLSLVFLALLAAAVRPAWAAAPVALLIALAAFFRDPERAVPAGSRLYLSPADGKIDDVEELAGCPWFDGPVVRVGIFLSLADVHVTRIPERSGVVGLHYVRGAFRSAFSQAGSAANENLVLVLEVPVVRRRFAVRQIAGILARRIVCQVGMGDVVERGDRFGMIRFGSRVELYLPREGLELAVGRGSVVRGGVSVIGSYLQATA